MNNGSNNGYLDEKMFHDSTKLSILNNTKNMGSAHGYAQGFDHIFKTLQDMDYIWLLDDDNLPTEDCLDGLLKLYALNKHEKRLFAAFRDDRTEMKKSGNQQYTTNAFFGFDFFSKFTHKKNNPEIVKNNLVLCDTVPYGGLLLPTKIAKSKGLPNEKYYLYNDDNEYTYRYTKDGYKIFVSLNDTIHDLESSWYRRESVPMFEGFFKTNMLLNGAYTIRNRTYFELTNTTTKKRKYFFNITIYLFYVFLFYMPKTFSGVKRFNLIIRMIRYGLHERLGKMDKKEYEI